MLRKTALTRDIRNIARGFCVTCGEPNCPGFISVSGRVLCDYCGCPPAKHKMLDEEDGQLYGMDILEPEEDAVYYENASPSTAKKRRQNDVIVDEEHEIEEASSEEEIEDEFLDELEDGEDVDDVDEEEDGDDAEEDDVLKKKKKRRGKRYLPFT